ncbi:MAG: ABC transporter substrate-binding protein [Bradyrhizobium sp.]|nr:ABC transporter substrate-binding protein [Bradyrhizobium sp.]
MRQFKRARSLAAGLAVTLAIAGSLASAAHAQEKKFVAQGGAPVPYTGFLAVYVGQQANFFKEEGLDVELRYASGAPQATQIAAANQADVALVTIEPTINGYDKGIRGKVFSRINNELIYYIAVPEDSPIKRVEDLKGKKIGVASFGSAAVPVVKSILRSAGIEPQSDTILPVGVMDQALAALKSGNVQAFGLYDGIYFALERAGVKLRYFKHPTLAGFGNTGLFASDETMKTRKEDLCKFGRAFAKATLFAVTNPEAAVRLYWKAVPASRRGADDAEAMKNGLTEVAPMLKVFDLGFPPKTKYGVVDRAALEKYIALNRQEGVINADPPVDAIATGELIDCINDFDSEAVRKKAREWKS